jgi:hypothetical protein
MNWKAILIIIKEIDAALDGKTFKARLSGNEINSAQNGAKLFSQQVSLLTSGNASLGFPDQPIEINKLNRVVYVDGDSNKGVWPEPEDIYAAIVSQGVPWQWGNYDSIFVVYPILDPQRQGGWGRFNPSKDYGATYGAINASEAELVKCNGEVFLHEWLHGACGFFNSIGNPMPTGDADGAGSHGYPKDSNGCFIGYYKDLMKCNVPEHNKKLGVPLSEWNFAAPRNSANVVGFSKWVSGYNKNSFINEFNGFNGFNIVPFRDVHYYGNGFIQDFTSAKGDYAIMQGFDSKTAFIVKPGVWKKYLQKGNIHDLGYPINNLHTWEKGEIQDFKLPNGQQSGIMQKQGSNEFYVVKAGCWTAFTSSKIGGPKGIGYPTGDEFVWFSQKRNMQLYRQDFENNRWIWVMAQSPWLFGTDADH